MTCRGRVLSLPCARPSWQCVSSLVCAITCAVSHRKPHFSNPLTSFSVIPPAFWSIFLYVLYIFSCCCLIQCCMLLFSMAALSDCRKSEGDWTSSKASYGTDGRPTRFSSISWSTPTPSRSARDCLHVRDWWRWRRHSSPFQPAQDIRDGDKDIENLGYCPAFSRQILQLISNRLSRYKIVLAIYTGESKPLADLNLCCKPDSSISLSISRHTRGCIRVRKHWHRKSDCCWN